MQACFIGHRTIEKNEELTSLIKKTIITLINKGVTTFLFGSMSAFDELSLEVVTELKESYPFIKRIYVRSAYPCIDKSYEEYLLQFYEATYFPPKLKNAGKCSYVERNCDMIDNATYCIFYYNENYMLPAKRTTKDNNPSRAPRNSGTKIAYNYAIKKNKIVINLHK